MEIQIQGEPEKTAQMLGVDKGKSIEDTTELSAGNQTMQNILKTFDEDMKEEIHTMRAKVQEEMILFKEIFLGELTQIKNSISTLQNGSDIMQNNLTTMKSGVTIYLQKLEMKIKNMKCFTLVPNLLKPSHPQNAFKVLFCSFFF